MIDQLEVRIDGGIARVRRAGWPTDAENNFGNKVDEQVFWIGSVTERVCAHTESNHRFYADWCSLCRRRRLVAFAGWTCVIASLIGLALLNWWPQ